MKTKCTLNLPASALISVQQHPQGRNNWLRTATVKGYFEIIRLHSPNQPAFDKTWEPATSSK